jgi:predicted nucleic acid-binding protein
MASYLLDTNLLLRAYQPADSTHLQALRVVRRLISNGEQVYITAQNLVEFWAVATRPVAVNGFGWDTKQVATQVQQIRYQFTLLQDSPYILGHWLQLVASRSVIGKRVHDARLVAVMLAYDITHLLTFNTQDFKSFTGIVLVHPDDVI